MILKRSALLILLLFTATFNLSCELDPRPYGPSLEADRSDLASEFIGNLVDEDYNSATAFFNAQMRRVVPERNLQRAWEGVLAQMGSYEGEAEKYLEEVEGLEAVNVITDFTEGQLNIRILFDDDNQITGLWFNPVE